MNAAGMDLVWGAIPYPALLIGGDERILGANPAAESFAAMSQRQMAGRPLARFQTIQHYLANILHQDWETAETLWHPDDVRRSRRLGITYHGAPVILPFPVRRRNG